jgi:hypothetical protein
LLSNQPAVLNPQPAQRRWSRLDGRRDRHAQADHRISPPLILRVGTGFRNVGCVSGEAPWPAQELARFSHDIIQVE